MHQAGGRGAAAPQILADQKAPPGSGGAPHYYLPPGFLTLGASLKSTEASDRLHAQDAKLCLIIVV